MRCFLRSLVFATLILISAIASAQTTQPAVDASWLQQFAASISIGTDAPIAVAYSRFENNHAHSFDDLREALADRKLMVCQCYVGIPQTLAGDIATALHDQPASDSVKRLFTPRTADGLKHADEVAASWVQNVMKPSAADAVGVLLFCADASSESDHPSDLIAKPAGPMIVLVDAETVGASVPKIRRVLFGDPRPQ